MTEITNINPPSPPPSSCRAIKFQYAASSPWAWVMQYIADLSPTKEIDSMMELESPSKMTSYKILQTEANVINTPSTSRHRRKNFPSMKAPSSEPQLSTVISLDVLEANTSKFVFAAHGTSFAFDGVDDKDELVRTLQRCRCDHLNISPPSLLLRWDLTREECTNLVGGALPILPGNTKNVAVLKEPFGASGRGIHFVSSHEDIYNVIESHRKKSDTTANSETGLSDLDKIIAQKGRIPFWVLQAEISPALLIQGGRKFHIRTYVTAVEKLDDPDVIDMYVYNRHEVRLASVPVSSSSSTNTDNQEYDRLAHITNASSGTVTKDNRLLLQHVPELMERNMQEKVELFVAELFGQHVAPDVKRRCIFGSRDGALQVGIGKFAIAGIDLMVTENNQLFLLETNLNPLAPPEDAVQPVFKEHLIGFMSDVIALTTGCDIDPYTDTFTGGRKNFVHTHTILENQST